MGGVWSGRRAAKKAVVEGRLALDTADLRRMDLLVPGAADRAGSLTWSRGGAAVSSVGYTLTVGSEAGTLSLHYQAGQPAETCDYPVRLVATPCHLGGVRWWFVCPLVKNGAACGRRVRKLYLSGRYFGCRHCHALTYRSRQESDPRVYALARGGLDAVGHPGRMSVTQLGLALKALTLIQKRLGRPGV